MERQNGFLTANSSDLLWLPYIMMCSIEHECVVLVVSCKLQYGGNPYCEYLSTLLLTFCMYFGILRLVCKFDIFTMRLTCKFDIIQ